MKIYCYVKYAKLSKYVQEILFDLGISWNSGEKTIRPEIDCFAFDSSINKYGFCYAGRDYFQNNSYKEVSIPEFIETLQDCLKKPIYKIKLTEDYEAEYQEGNSFVKVGCQEIPVEKVLELAKLIKNI